MKERNLDHDFPPDLQTDNLYSKQHLEWQEELVRKVALQARAEAAGKVKEGNVG